MKQEEPKPTNQWQTPDQEGQPLIENPTELTEEDLDKVSGGEISGGWIRGETTNKAKTYDKNVAAMEEYLKG